MDKSTAIVLDLFSNVVHRYKQCGTVFPAPRTTPFLLKKVEYCSAESKMLHMRHICTFLFFAINVPQVKHICLT